MIASELLSLLYLYEPSLTMLLLAELFALCLTWGIRTVGGAKEQSHIHGIAFHNCQMWVLDDFQEPEIQVFFWGTFCSVNSVQYLDLDLSCIVLTPILVLVYANSILVTWVSLVIQLLNCIHFPYSLNTRKNLNLNRMRSTMDFKPGGHGQRGDNFTVSVATTKKPSTGNWWSDAVVSERSVCWTLF